MGSLSKIGQLLAALLLACGSANAAISRTQAVSANASSVTLSSTTSGDAILVIVGNNAAATAPSLLAGYTNLASSTQTSAGCRVAWKISSGGDTTTGTWTNGTHIVALVYSGCNQTTPFTVNGASLAVSANTTTMSFGGQTMTAAGVSWIAGVGYTKSATAGLNSNTTNLTSRTNQTTICGLDSGAAQASWSTETFSYTTSAIRFSMAVEILAATSQSATNGFFRLFKR